MCQDKAGGVCLPVNEIVFFVVPWHPVQAPQDMTPVSSQWHAAVKGAMP